MSICLRNYLGFLSFSYLSLKEVALDRRGMVTSPILYLKCMYRYMCMHPLTGKEGDPEAFLCEISNRQERGGRAGYLRAPCSSASGTAAFPSSPSRRLSRRSLRKEGGSTTVSEKRKQVFHPFWREKEQHRTRMRQTQLVTEKMKVSTLLC